MRVCPRTHSNAYQGYGFVELRNEEEDEYVCVICASIIVHSEYKICLSKFFYEIHDFDHRFVSAGTLGSKYD